MEKAMYEVTVGCRHDDEAGVIDAARRETLIATTAVTAIQKVSLRKDKFISEVRLIARED